jgi:phospholipase DDHD1
LGSPLAVFLALRGVRPSGSGLQDHILPKKVCKHLFNLFHPCDAVAYRIEPLVLKHYTSIMPIEVHRSDDKTNAKHIPYKEMQNKLLNKTADLELSTASSLASSSSVSCKFIWQCSL